MEPTNNSVLGLCVGILANHGILLKTANNAVSSCPRPLTELRPLNDYVIVVLAGWRPLGPLLRLVPTHFSSYTNCLTAPNHIIPRSLLSLWHNSSQREVLCTGLCGQPVWRLFEDACSRLSTTRPTTTPLLCRSHRLLDQL